MGPVHTHRGFTLIELLVVTGIILVVTGVIFAGQTGFNDSVLLSSTAYDIALSMRSAETFGLGTRAQGGIANVGYGVHFTTGAKSSYILFADSAPLAGGVGACHALPANGASAPDAYPGDCVYTAGPGGDTLISTYTLARGATISNFCASSGTTWLCAGAGFPSLDIVFLRPNGTPFISEGGQYNAVNPVTKACLTITSGTQSRYIAVSATGEIVATAASCP